MLLSQSSSSFSYHFRSVSLDQKHFFRTLVFSHSFSIFSSIVSWSFSSTFCVSEIFYFGHFGLLPSKSLPRFFYAVSDIFLTHIHLTHLCTILFPAQYKPTFCSVFIILVSLHCCVALITQFASLCFILKETSLEKAE